MTGAEQSDNTALCNKLKKMERKLVRAEEQLIDYERVVDRTQHLLNKRIEEVEAAHAEISAYASELANSESRFRQMAEAAFEAILIHSNGIILDINAAAAAMYDIPRDVLLGSDIDDLEFRACSAIETHWQDDTTHDPFEVTHVRGDGSSFPVEVRSREIIYEGIPALVTAVRDITAHKELQAKLELIANSDPLTGAGNRRFFLDAGKHEYFRSLRYDQPLTLLILDIDYFKRINDTYGHDSGDIALCEVTKICTATLRTSDIFARFGGEEFVALLPDTGLEDAKISAERIRSNIASHVFNIGEKQISFTVSIGIAALCAGDEGISPILTRADKGLYIAKDNGRNQIVTITNDH